MVLKILNLYAGIGGNRKLWDTLGLEIEVTAIENNPEIAKIYKDFFPKDKVIVTDAHEYLLKHYQEFDFIWSSPPCPSHSRIRKNTAVERGQNKAIYPDMKLYEEILFLKHYFKGKWVVENVISFYKPLILPCEFGNHFFWTNFPLNKLFNIKSRNHDSKIKDLEERKGFKGLDWKKFKVDKRLVLRNCVEPELGLQIFKMAFKEPQKTLI